MTEPDPVARARAIAYYLPQYYPVEENDEWWGRGFTEWTNVTRATPLFPGHRQPRLPADLGFYDLRIPEVRHSQANLAQRYGVEAFCYWHYWFAGRRILQRPFEEVLTTGQPDFPFLLGWANESWTGIWYGDADRVLIEQTYPGPDDHRRHLSSLLPAFHDPRYLRVDDKPVFHVLRPHKVPDLQQAAEIWREVADNGGLDGLYVTGEVPLDQTELPGLDGVVPVQVDLGASVWRHWLHRAFGLPVTYDYRRLWEQVVPDSTRNPHVHPCVIPNWDNTPRSRRRGRVYRNSSPALFRKQVRRAVELTSSTPLERRLLFIKSWNEWAEGNHLEPDRRHGLGWLEALAAEVLGEVPDADDSWYVNAGGSRTDPDS